MRSPILVLLLAGPPAVAADCPTASDAASAEAAAGEVVTAYLALDEAAFIEGRDHLRAALPCLDGALEPPAVASVHRAMGLIAFTDGDTARATRAFLAARRLDDRLPAGLDDANLPHMAFWNDADPTIPRQERSIGGNAVGWLLVDGTEATRAPTDAPYLLQQLDERGQVLLSTYAWPDDEPVALVQPPPAVPVPTLPERSPATGRRVVGATMALASLVAMGVGGSRVSEAYGTEYPGGFGHAGLPDVNTTATTGAWTLGLGSAGLVGGLTMAAWPGKRTASESDPDTTTARLGGR